MLIRFLNTGILSITVSTIINYFLYSSVVALVTAIFVVQLVCLSLAFHRGHLRFKTVVHLLVACVLWYVLPFSVYLTGGIQSPLLSWYVIVPIGCLFLLEMGLHTAFYTACTLISIVAFWLADVWALPLPSHQSPLLPLRLCVSYGSLLTLVFSLTRFF